MHIGLNAQEAIIRHSFGILERIWKAVYPNLNFKPFKMRPIRRIGLLRLALAAWTLIKSDIPSTSTRKGSRTTTQGTLLSSLFWLFEEAIPLALDAPGILSSTERTMEEKCQF